MVVESAFGFCGWVIFGSSWTVVRTVCRRPVQLGGLLVLCLIIHYVWAVCYRVVSIIVSALMAILLLLRKVLKIVGTLFFQVQKLLGMAPKALDVDYIGPGTGSAPETALLRGLRKGATQRSLWWSAEMDDQQCFDWVPSLRPLGPIDFMFPLSLTPPGEIQILFDSFGSVTRFTLAEM